MDFCADSTAAGKNGHCIIKQVDQDPFDLNRIKEKGWNIIMLQGKGDMFMTFTVQHQGVGGYVNNICLLLLDPRHTGKVGKLGDQSFDLVYLLNDGGCALVKDIAVVADGFQVAFAKALGRELDWGKWIFDFMGNPACHLLPGSQPLGFFQFGQVVKHDDITNRLFLFID